MQEQSTGVPGAYYYQPIMPRSHQVRELLKQALTSGRHTEGSTHAFYLYPARFSPDVANAVISAFSTRNDCVLDPFMGGGTAVVEALMSGRYAVGADVNSLGHFVASVRTQPLSSVDEDALVRWAAMLTTTVHGGSSDVHVSNLPANLHRFFSSGLRRIDRLARRRQRAFARCALLRLGQWALETRQTAITTTRLAEKLFALVDDMLLGLQDFVERCAAMDVAKNEITSRRHLLWCDARHLDRRRLLVERTPRPRLVLTSPPYPRVHVLYHRWQVRGRRETAAPYWIANVPDGRYASYYTGGSRTQFGERNYFAMIQDVFSSLRRMIHPEAVVAQLVGFADIRQQLPMYLHAMSEAGYHEDRAIGARRLWRGVPNRKWHAQLQGAVDAASEVLLVHRPGRGG